VTGRPSASGHAGALVERDAELARIVDVLESASAGSGSVLLIEGPAGIGKTALADAARAHANRDGMRVLHGRGTEFEREYPFGVVRQCLEPVVRRDGDRERLLRGAAQLAEPLLLGVADAIDVPLPGLLHGLYWLVASLADETPVVIVVDDAHWADEPSLRFLSYLARRVDSLRVAIVIGARRADDPGGGGAGSALEEIRAHIGRGRLEVRPLGVDAVARVLETIAGGSVDEGFARACHAAAGGNPFLVEELAHSLRADDVPFVAACAERVGTVAPSTVADAVAMTLARLGPVPTSLARAAAVLGDGCALDLAAQLVALPVADAAAAAGELVRTGVLADAPELRFRHPILAGAVRATLTAPELAVAHATAADVLRARGAGPERIALQLLHAAPSGDAQVVSELRQAADHAHDRGAPATAAALLERALAEPPADDLRGELLVALGRVELASGSPASAMERLRAAHACATDPRTRALAVTLLGATPGDRANQVGIIEMAAAILPEVEPLDADLALRLRGLLVLMGRLDKLPELTGATAAEASFLGHLVFASMRPDASAAEIADIARRSARQVDALLEDDASWLGFTGLALGFIWTDRLADAERVIDRAIAQARRRGSITYYASAMTMRANMCRRAGRLRDAEADARAALEAALVGEWSFARGIAPLACTLVDQGRADEAASELAAVVPGQTIPEGPPMLPVLLSRMWVRAARREHAAALADWEEAQRRASLRGVNAAWIEDFAVAAEVHGALGDREAADAAVTRALELAEAWDTPGARGQALHARARAGSGGDVVELLRGAVDLLADSPARLHEARARVGLGAALRRGGHRVDSRRPLREGYELARVCGAEGLAEHARSELRASGIRLQREAASGADALTPSERRIAEMAASGLSNPEIAQELFLTVKTIEMHLTRTYRKLDIRRRADVARALGADV
jgi:DNA-binding CsgD family transcriptional regulator